MVVGAPLFQLIFPDPEQPVLPPGTKVVQLDIYPWRSARTSRPDVSFLADPEGRAGRAGRANPRA